MPINEIKVDALLPGMSLAGEGKVEEVNGFDYFNKNSACDRKHFHVRVEGGRKLCYHFQSRVLTKVDAKSTTEATSTFEKWLEENAG